MSLLKVINLHTYFETKKGLIKAVCGVSFEVQKGKTLGIVGESGSGKSQTAISILKLFEKNQKFTKAKLLLKIVLFLNLVKKKCKKSEEMKLL